VVVMGVLGGVGCGGGVAVGIVVLVVACVGAWGKGVSYGVNLAGEEKWFRVVLMVLGLMNG
jgi:hypothetical protein